MKLSSNTTSVLKNFASINQNLVIKEGKEITTMSAMKNIVARAEVEEEFPQEVAIYDLNEFLSALSLFKSPNLEFQDTYVNITEENNPKTSLKYFYSDPSVVTTPSKMITMPSNEVTFTLESATLSNITKAAAVIGPFIFAFFSAAYDTRFGIMVLLIILILGLMMFPFIDIEEGRRVARETDIESGIYLEEE